MQPTTSRVSVIWCLYNLVIMLWVLIGFIIVWSLFFLHCKTSCMHHWPFIVESPNLFAPHPPPLSIWATTTSTALAKLTGELLRCIYSHDILSRELPKLIGMIVLSLAFVQHSGLGLSNSLAFMWIDPGIKKTDCQPGISGNNAIPKNLRLFCPTPESTF